MYLVKSPSLLQLLYPSLTWHMPRDEKVVYLTFDDGPIPDVTAFVLKTLKSYQAKATFFCIGDNIVKHPTIFQQIIEDEHAVGNHTFNHLRGWDTATDIYLQNFKACQKLTKTPLFRPPYGRIKRAQIRSLKKEQPNLKFIMWDVLSADYDVKVSGEECYQNVIKNTENGSIIVFHDSVKAFESLEYALPRVLKYLTEQGFSFKSLNGLGI